MRSTISADAFCCRQRPALILTCNARAESRIPVLFMPRSTLWMHDPGIHYELFSPGAGFPGFAVLKVAARNVF